MLVYPLRSFRRAVAFALLAAAPVLATQAVEVEGLYQVRVPVEGRDEGARQTALAHALRQVLSKVSGTRALGVDRGVSDASANPARFVQSFGYLTVPILGPEGAPAEQLQLEVRFDAAAVDSLLRERQMPVWGRVRPGVLLWLAAESDGGRMVLGADDESGLAQVAVATSQQRGVPLVLPLLDLEDRARVRVSDVWGGFRENLLEAAGRYPSDAVLVARVYRVLPTLWEARWRLFVGNASEDWETQGDIAEAAVEEGIHEAVDRLAARFSQAASSFDAGGVELVVAPIRSVEDYARALRYLSSLDLVTRVSVRRVERERVAFHVEARGGSEALTQVIALGRTLAPLPGGDPLFFELLP